MGQVSVIATVTVKDGTADTFPAAFDEFFRPVEVEPETEHNTERVLHDRARRRPGRLRRSRRQRRVREARR